MNFDVRIPIGLMFSIFGVMLVLFGLVADEAIYQRSMGVNVNLWWGLVLLAFGAVMLWMSWRARPVLPEDDGPGRPRPRP